MRLALRLPCVLALLAPWVAQAAAPTPAQMVEALCREVSFVVVTLEQRRGLPNMELLAQLSGLLDQAATDLELSAVNERSAWRDELHALVKETIETVTSHTPADDLDIRRACERLSKAVPDPDVRAGRGSQLVMQAQ